jgi:cobyrinic acid a,c-diamide synthase
MAVAVSARFDVDAVIAVARGGVAGREKSSPTAEAATDAIAGDEGLSRGAGIADLGGGPGAASAAHTTAARQGNESPAQAPGTPRSVARPVIAVARDEAFCFYYPENLELLIEAGAAVEFFSPLRGEWPHTGVAGVYLGGGYPELHGPALASNVGLWSALKDFHAAKLPIYAECGGFMVLTEGLTDSDGRMWPMGGLLPGFARMSGKLAALGYRHATALRSNLLAEPGEVLRGHEFRYSTWVRDTEVEDGTSAWELKGTRGEVPNDAAGYTRGNLLASYLHVHFGQRRELAERFVQRLSRAR